MGIKTKLVLFGIAIAMASIGRYYLEKDRSAFQGVPCVAQQGAKVSADGTPVVCSEDIGWKPAQ
ncbi:hypothetical protein RN01_24895 [Cupriavidus sp. SHE]|nr:hypothetical protein RN01_24895 [Cupriavidus sp. SHE]GMG94662.1 hypothetical protein Cmtc_58820 [Cupriavidus sp. TKC]